MKLRTVRRITPLIRALTMGAVLSSATVMTVGALVGCTDENAPETHVKYLEDPIRRSAAVKRLIQFYEDAMTKDKKNRSGPFVKPLLDIIVDPLAKVAMSGELDKRAQGDVLAFLADTRDPRVIPTLVKALEDYRPDDKRGEQFDGDMGTVVRSLGIMKAKEASKGLIKLFVNLRASTPKAGYKSFYKLLHDALLELADPAWESELVALLNRPIKTLKDIKTLKSEVYWQATAAELLGMLKAKGGVVPLIKVVLSPLKADIATTAVSALIKIGKPSIDAGVKLLNGEDTALMTYAKEENLKSMKDRGMKVTKKAEKSAEKAYLGAAAIIVANIGRIECVEPMLAALEKGDDLTKAIIARELHKLPASAKVTEAYKKAYESTSLTQTIPPGLNAKEQLSTAAGSFFDGDLAVWSAQHAAELKGEEADTAPIQDTTLGVVMKLAGKAQWGSVTRLAAIQVNYPKKTTIGKAYAKELKLAKEVVDKCSDKSDCYMKLLQDPKSHQKKTQFQGIKAAYMVGVLGDDKTPEKLVAILPKVSNPAVRFVVASIIDRRSPKGNKALADKLQKIIDKNTASKSKKLIQGDAPLKTVVYRLRARAQ